MELPLKVWSKFSTTKESSTLKFQIVEAPPHRTEDIAELLFNHFVTGEAIAKASGIPKSNEAMAEYKSILLEILKEQDTHIVVCCMDNANEEIDEIIGASLMALTKKDKPLEIKAKTKELQKFFEVITWLKQNYGIIAEQKVDQFYGGRGIVVHSNYRGLGIAYELVKTRRRICQELGVPLTAALMTAYGTQKAAERDGWETVSEYFYEELGKYFEITFDENGPALAKLMVARA